MRSQHAWGGTPLVSKGDILTFSPGDKPRCRTHPDRPIPTRQILGTNWHARIIMANIYSSPESFDLSIISVLDGDAGYDFDMVIAWLGKHTAIEDGIRSTVFRIYWAADSGCSCPSPFEDYTSVEDLTLLDWTQAAWDAMADAALRVDTSEANQADFLRTVGQTHRELMPEETT